jgi:hypothetical protein
MYSKLLPEVLSFSEQQFGVSKSDHLKMVIAIHKVVSSSVSYDAMASSLLILLAHEQRTGGEGRCRSQSEQYQVVRKLRSIVRAFAKDAKPAFDGYALMESLLSHDVSVDNWSVRDEEDKARLMFQCATLSVASLSSKKDGEVSGVQSELRKRLVSIKKLLLTWCCSDYGQRCNEKTRGKQLSRQNSNVDTPDFSSAFVTSSGEEVIPAWLNVMRCLLFMEEADSPLMKAFVFPDASAAVESDWEEEVSRIRVCHEFGGTLNDEMIWEVINACSSEDSRISPDMAIRLLENLFECCGNGRNGALEVADPTVVWELYNLVQFSPPELGHSNEDKDSDESSSSQDNEEDLPR